MTATVTRQALADDLRALGVQPGDLLFVHSSFKSLGPVEGDAVAVLGALEDSIGPEGLLLMPSFNLVKPAERAATWNHATTPSTVGWLTEFFRTMPGTYRSDHYSHSVAARGKTARTFVGEHRSREGFRSPWDLEPWGRTYGTHSPLMKAYRAGGKILLLGVDYHSSTYIHLIEVFYWNRRLAADSQASYRWINRDKLGQRWDEIGRLQRGRVGDADCRLFLIRDFVDGLLAEVERDPRAFCSNAT